MTDVEYQRQRYEKFFRPAYDALMKFYPLTLDDLDGEEWKDIAGYEGYKISSYGRVKSFKRSNPKILRPESSKGYLRVTLGKGNRELVHRLVATIFLPNRNNKPEVNHIDGCKLNNFVDNLEWVTKSENKIHSLKLGLSKSGEEMSNALLTNQQVKWCREVFIPNDTEWGAAALARKLGKTQRTIERAVHGEGYKNAGGYHHERSHHPPRVPDTLRQKIRTEYIKGDLQFGAHALARKYGYSKTTIQQITNEK